MLEYFVYLEKPLIMKKFLFLLIVLMFTNGYAYEGNFIAYQTKTKCTYKGKVLYEGPRGGCYYINKNNNKTYVDRSFCRCK